MGGMYCDDPCFADEESQAERINKGCTAIEWQNCGFLSLLLPFRAVTLGLCERDEC